MKKALIMGITGTFGSHVARALAAQGWAIRALMRDPAKAPEAARDYDLQRGDAGDIDSIRRAAADAEVIVYAVNPPYYAWNNTALPWLNNAVTVAEERGLTLIFPGNVYVHDPADGPVFDEQSPSRPITSKGRIRVAMEERLRLAANQGARVILARAGDFIAADAKSAWLAALLKKTKRGYTLHAPGPRDLKHTWAYAPDLAHAVAELIARRAELTAFSAFHFGGYHLSFDEMAAAIQQATGTHVNIKNFPWWIMRSVAPFSPFVRSLLEMRYLWNREICLDDGKLRRILGSALKHTDVATALRDAGFIAGAETTRDVILNPKRAANP
ncbi:MAG: NAD-dependent epimerase/dehydratase family protein [Pseudomonadota bacterium]